MSGRDGGCLCGALRYRIDGAPIDAGYCHCSRCRRASGAPVVAWLTVPAAAFAWSLGTAAGFRAAAGTERFFCASCGSPLLFRRGPHAPTVDVTVASLDQPAEVRLDYHIWCADRLPWFDTDDRLPRYADGGPDTYDL